MTTTIASSQPRSVHDFFRGDAVDLAGLGQMFDALDHNARLEAMRLIDAREQAKLFEAAASGPAITLDDFVAPKLGELVEVIHHGKNSLPMFTSFQKRFTRSSAGGGNLWGYNEQTMKAFTGPGYFVAKPVDARTIVVDYFDVPPDGAKLPAGWPGVLPNSARLGRFVYFQMRDYMRGVSKHVTVGRANRGGKDVDNWFLLLREDR